MQAMYGEFKGRPFEILAVSIDSEGPDVVKEFADKYGITFPVLHDRKGKIKEMYKTTGVPESFVLNRDGNIVKKVIGAAEWDATVNRDLVRRLLAQRN